MLATLVIGITLAFCIAFFSVSWRVKRSASSSFLMYAIGAGTMPLYLILFSDIATIMGAGNFIGHATEGFTQGVSHLPFVWGEQGSKIVFALLFAGFAGRFTYITVSDMMFDLFHRDKFTKILTGLLTGSIMIAWLAGQSKGLGYIIEQFTSINPVPVIIFFNIIFIVNTFLGGFLSVVWTDLIQGGIVLVFGSVFYFFAFAPVHWNLAELGARLTATAGPSYWDFSSVSIGTLLVNFITGLFGVLAAQAYWQRCFAAKSPSTARNAMLISGIFVVIAVSLTTLVGMTARAFNPNIDPHLAMPWYMVHYMPTYAVAITFSLILAAAMSSACSLLNSAAVIFVNDVWRTMRPELKDEELVTNTKKATIVIGALACGVALYSDTIIGMFSKAYTMAGGGVVPVLIVGLLWRQSRDRPFAMGERNSRLTPWGVRIAIILGAVVSLEANILWGIAISATAAVVISLITSKNHVSEQRLAEN